MSKDNTQKTWIKVTCDFKSADELQNFLDNLDIDFGDDSRLVAKFSRKRGFYVTKEPIPFSDYEADQLLSVLMMTPDIYEVDFDNLSESI